MVQDRVAAAAKPPQRRLIAGIGEIHPVDHPGRAGLFMRHDIDKCRRQDRNAKRHVRRHGAAQLAKQRPGMRPQLRAVEPGQPGLMRRRQHYRSPARNSPRRRCA